MKRKFLFIIGLYLLNNTIIQGQEAKINIPKSKFGVDMAVPDIPAFKAISFDPSTILRPSTAREFSMVLPQFYSRNGATLPSSFAMEIAPFKMFNSRTPITLEKYHKNSVINSLRLSLGTNRDSTEKQPKATQISFGLRINMIDKGELNADPLFLEEESKLMTQRTQDELKLEDAFKKEHGLNIADKIPNSLANEFDQYKKDNLPLESEEIVLLEELKKRYKEKYWNAERWDVAVALAGRSQDEYFNNFGFKKLSFWTTYAFPVKEWAQIAAGYNAAFNKDVLVAEAPVSYWQQSFNLRGYGGNNRLKGFLEGQYRTKELNSSHSFLLISGAEYNVIEKYGVWVEFYIGMKKVRNEANAKFVSNFDIKFALPEK